MTRAIAPEHDGQKNYPLFNRLGTAAAGRGQTRIRIMRRGAWEKKIIIIIIFSFQSQFPIGKQIPYVYYSLLFNNVLFRHTFRTTVGVYTIIDVWEAIQFFFSVDLIVCYV